MTKQESSSKTAERLAVIIGTTFGSGYSPAAPGTAGAAVVIVALWFLPLPSIVISVHLIVLFFFIGVWAATLCENRWGADPGRVNWDEAVGMMISIIALPKTAVIYGGAFLLFRLFDVVKPFPVNRAERFPGGWGIMIDDVIAGFYTNIVLQLFIRLF
ncbi:MAG: phosphatidylglycerophosphatase A [candidate division KSB1 bacterium]|nr:phosphatidylglycerophosphatase A [candidate division KSB1 bacterium]